MQFPIAFSTNLGDEYLFDIGMGNRNERAFSVVFPEPISSVDAVLRALAREPSAPAYLALKNFLLRTGQSEIHGMKPQDFTRFARNAFIQQRLVLGRKPRLYGTHSLHFDGNSVVLLQGNKPVQCWTAVSGRAGYQGAEHQESKDRGPLPEGRWVAKQSRFEKIGPYGALVGATGRGTWPGSTASWGRLRVWLEPVGETKTYGRSGFSIHGGVTPGSAGCVDLTSNMDEFSRYFLAYGRDMTMVVIYTSALAPVAASSR